MWIRTRFDRAVPLASLAVAIALASAPARGDDDDLAAYRRRVHDGLVHYEAGRYADAILAWQSIYEELGPKKAYRLSFNLARAYEAHGDATLAAERYASFLAEVDARRRAGEALSPIVEKNAAEAAERLRALERQHGRIEVAKATPPVLVRVDAQEPRAAGFTAFVRPGHHRVVFGVGTPSETAEDVDVAAGAVVQLAPPRPPPAAEPPASPGRVETPPSPPPKTITTHPFSPILLVVGAGATLAGAVVPLVLYARALDAKSTFDAATDPAARDKASAEYDDRKTAAYVSLAIPASLAAITGGLAIWYFAGAETKTAAVRVTPTASGLQIHGIF